MLSHLSMSSGPSLPGFEVGRIQIQCRGAIIACLLPVSEFEVCHGSVCIASAGWLQLEAPETCMRATVSSPLHAARESAYS